MGWTSGRGGQTSPGSFQGNHLRPFYRAVRCIATTLGRSVDKSSCHVSCQWSTSKAIRSNCGHGEFDPKSSKLYVQFYLLTIEFTRSVSPQQRLWSSGYQKIRKGTSHSYGTSCCGLSDSTTIRSKGFPLVQLSISPESLSAMFSIHGTHFFFAWTWRWSSS